jgi:hypothetical protein
MSTTCSDDIKKWIRKNKKKNKTLVDEYYKKVRILEYPENRGWYPGDGFFKEKSRLCHVKIGSKSAIIYYYSDQDLHLTRIDEKKNDNNKYKHTK